MTRSNAREIVLHMIMDLDYTKNPEVVETRLNKEYYATLQGESDVYAERPNKKQLAYIKSAVAGVQEQYDALQADIAKYAKNWNLDRISRITRAILTLAIYEIRHVEDVPTGVAVNEALVLTKKYESEETASFVNGILGELVRGENLK